jgi:ankyrin repeat protein
MTEQTIFDFARFGDLKRLKECPGGVNVLDGNYISPLKYAIRRGHLKCVKYLVEQRGTHVNGHGEARDRYYHTPLAVAVWHGELECAQYLLDKGAYINGLPGHQSPLDCAVSIFRVDTIEWLLSNGADPFNCHSLGALDDDAQRMFKKARETFKEKQAIQAMMSVKLYPRLGQTSTLKVLPTEIIRRLHGYLV